ncbi:hypothetical protein ARMSODRAFT_980910 [Armillaria solidipes]|uniref:Uncharacterized protein n=1 Tax=Armillaria solidipes TaxID=1076256 RepID=A0A2H3AZL2_9AGAR|nr:hypothetical protein ARMSODRAFT_980910 [Armillaria solidipes]
MGGTDSIDDLIIERYSVGTLGSKIQVSRLASDPHFFGAARHLIKMGCSGCGAVQYSISKPDLVTLSQARRHSLDRCNYILVNLIDPIELVSLAGTNLRSPLPVPLKKLWQGQTLTSIALNSLNNKAQEVRMGNSSSNQSQGESDPSFSIGARRTNRFEERYFDEGSESMRNRMQFGNSVVEWNATLVIVWASLGLLLLMAGFICGHRRCGKLTDIESKALHGAVKLPMEDGENIKSQTVIGVVEDVPLA